MNTTDNFDLKVYEGDDLFNPLTVENANTEAIDDQLFKNQNAGVQIATELLTQNVHAITRNVPDASVFRFTAVSRFSAGDVFEVDGVQVTALTTSGEQLPDGAYVIGSEVLCVLKGTVLTVFISTSSVNTAKNAEKLGGQLPAHYATAGDLADVAQIAQSAGELAEGNTQEITTLKENLETDSDWVSIGTNAFVRKVGRTVMIHVEPRAFSLTANTWLKGFDLPTGYAPTKTIYILGFTSPTDSAKSLSSITSTGTINFNTSTTGSHVVGVDCTYVV